MSVSVAEHVMYQIANSPVREYPYPHLYVESVFPDDFYAEMRDLWPKLSDMTCLNDTGRVTGNAYRERFILTLEERSLSHLSSAQLDFWSRTSEWLLGSAFRDAIIYKFQPFFAERFGKQPIRLDTTTEALLVRDLSSYAIKPHTDVPTRLASLLFYCPENMNLSHLGTSLYKVKDPNVDLDPKLHHPLELFTRVATMEYKPNSLFAFMRTHSSYHGVEKITDPDVERDLLLYDIRLQKVVLPTNKISWPDRVLSWLIRKT